MFKSLIRHRLQNYKIQVVKINTAYDFKLKKRKSVAVIGSGLAGISSAVALSERGFDVTIYEKNDYSGGKTGAWNHTFADGYKVNIDHGFHAFFYQYYNLWAFIKKLKIDISMRPVEDYLVLSRNKEHLSFKNIEKTPALNIISLGKNGFYKFSEMLKNPKSAELSEFLNYNENKTFRKYDNQSFQDFSDRLNLSEKLKTVFNSFSRAFFAEPDQMSMAELIKSFHFFYLSHDYGIDYDYFTGNYYECFTKPVLDYLTKQNVKIFTGKKIERIEKNGKQLIIDNNVFDYAVIATDTKGTKTIAQKCEWMQNENSTYFNKLSGLQNSNGYAVLKLWIKGKINCQLPAFVIIDRIKALDSVTIFEKFDEEAEKWAYENKGTVIELHCYSVSEELFNKEKIKQTLIEELYYYFPELINKEIKYHYLQLDNNFTSFHTNQYYKRPDYKSPYKEVKFAGDWVKLPIPAMLMEAAFSSGIFAANEILAHEKLMGEPIWSVPLNGLIHGNKNKQKLSISA
jgi:carotenoid phi-ring synthase / carotenoid chi-ring synthase